MKTKIKIIMFKRFLSTTMAAKPKLLVTRIPEEIPPESLQMLEPQWVKFQQIINIIECHLIFRAKNWKILPNYTKLVLIGSFFLSPKINFWVWIIKNSNFLIKSLFFISFEITHWTKPGPIQKNALKELILDKQALFCLLTDKIDEEILDHAKNLQIIGKLNSMKIISKK